MDTGDGPVRTLSLPHFFNLLTDPKEEYPATPNVPENLWVRYPASRGLLDHAVSLKKEPPIRHSGPLCSEGREAMKTRLRSVDLFEVELEARGNRGSEVVARRCRWIQPC